MRPSLHTVVAVLIVVVWSFARPTTVSALQTNSSRQPDSARPIIGLALSGGGAKGLAHLGVLRTLERVGVHIDVVAGTSMGSMIGALYAMGLSLDSIESIVGSAEWRDIMIDEPDRDRLFLHQRRFDERSILTLPVRDGRVVLPTGAITGSNFVHMLQRATWPAATMHRFADLPRPFVAVATDIETGEAVPLHGGVLAQALRASAGVPGVLAPFELDGRYLVDGALSRNLPAEDARELGADIVVCSDVSDTLDPAEDLQSFVDVLNQVVTLTLNEARARQRAACDILIKPYLQDFSSVSFGELVEWVARGEVAAEEKIDELRSLVRGGVVELARPADFLQDSVRITRVEVRGCCRPQIAEFVERELRVSAGDYLGPDELGSRLRDIEATGLFDVVRYRLDASEAGDGSMLSVDVQERPRDRVGVGIRYDDQRRAALLFTATLHNLIRYGSVSRFDLRIGEETRIGATYLRRRGVTGRFEGGSSLNWSQARLKLPGPTRELGQYELLSASAFLGLVAGRSLFFGVEVLGERSATDVDALPALSLTSATGLLDVETLDRTDFPRSGVDLTARWEWGITDAAGSGHFSLLTVDGRYFIPLRDRLTLELGAFVGHGNGAKLPLHRTFFLGGAHRSAIFGNTQPLFHGLATQEIVGTSVQVARAGVRWDFATDLNVGFHVDAGGVMDAWTFPVEDPITGWALSAGWKSLVGPVWIDVAKASDGSSTRVSLSVGRRF